MSLEAYRAALATGSTTRARCWRVTRRDGVVIGATDHDRDIAFDGTTYEARAGFRGAEIAAGLGLSVDESEAEGALSSDRIAEADIRRGLFDGAIVEVFDVDWSDTSARKLLGVFEVGEIERTENAFRAETRSVTARLNQKEGRSFVPLCDATLGDARCGVNLAAGDRRAASSVVALVPGAGIVADLATSFAPGHFTRGLVRWTSGANAGTVSEVRAHAAHWLGPALFLWRMPSHPVAPGDAFDVTVGCAKTFDDCVGRFGNGVNFRGFPHMPGETAPVEYAVRGDPKQDGGAR